jgi:hypothetical protein
MTSDSRVLWAKRTVGATFLAALCGGVLFYFVDNPFTGVFKASLGLLVGGVALSAVLLCYVLIHSVGRVKRFAGHILLTLLFLSAGAVLVGTAVLRPYLQHAVSKEQWQEDIQFLAAATARTDPSPLAKGSFQKEAEKLKRELSGLTDEQIIVRSIELVGSLHDGHSNILPVQPATGFRMFPVQLYLFSDGFYVTAAAPEYGRLVGLRLTNIENTPIEQAYDAVKPLVGGDNEWTIKDRISLYLLCPEILHSKSIIDSEEAATFTFVSEGGATVSYSHWTV